MLPEAEVRDISRELPSMIHPSDYYPLLIVQAGSGSYQEKLEGYQKGLQETRMVSGQSGNTGGIFTYPFSGWQEY